MILLYTVLVTFESERGENRFEAENYFAGLAGLFASACEIGSQHTSFSSTIEHPTISP